MSKKSAIRNPNSAMGRILIVDDQKIVHLTLKRLLESEGYAIDSAYGGKECLSKLAHCRLQNETNAELRSENKNPELGIRNRNSKYDLVILDIYMPDMDGIEVLREIRKRGLDVSVIILTGYATMESAAQALSYGACGFIMKPVENVTQFRNRVREGVHKAQIARESKRFYQPIVSGQVDSLTIDDKVYKAPALHEEHKEIFQRLIEVMRDAIVFLDFDGNITFANAAFAQLIGESYQNLLGTRFESFVADKDRDKVVEVFTQLSSGQFAVSIPAQLKTSLGSFLSTIISSSPIYYEMEYRGIGIVISDVTDIEAVRRKVELLANLVENARYDMIFVMNSNWQIIESNSLARSSFAYSRSEMLSLDMGALFKFGADESWESIVDSIRHDSQWRGELMATSKGGKEFPVEVTVSNPGGETSGTSVICFMRDITERKRAEEEKSNFMSAISHEIRTPLTSITNAVSIVEMAGELNENQRKFLSIADRNLGRLGKLINQVLDISRIEQGKLEMNFEMVDVKSLAADIISSLKHLADDKRLKITDGFPDDLPKVYADKDRLEQVLTNLIENATKFTEEGGQITIDAKLLPRSSANYVTVSVTDTGEGIPPEYHEQIFDRFRQIGSSSCYRSKGVGLGLAICKNIIERHRGKIWVESEVGKGSTFAFTIPVDKKNYEAGPPPLTADESSLTICAS